MGPKKGGSQLQTKNVIIALAYNPFNGGSERQLIIYVCIPSILLNTWHSLYRKLFRRLWITFVDIFVLILGGGAVVYDPQK